MPHAHANARALCVGGHPFLSFFFKSAFMGGGRLTTLYAHAHANARASCPPALLSYFCSKCGAGLLPPYAHAHANARALWVGGHPFLSFF